jgi:hypothetical protein
MKALLMFFCVLLSGCVQSLNQFYTNDLKIELPQISGEWIWISWQGEDVSKRISLHGTSLNTGIALETR